MRRTPLLLLSAVLLAGCRAESPTPADPGSAGTAPATPALVPVADGLPPVPAELRGVVAAHWFGGQWPKNWLAGFRREQVDGDFAALKADGFDTVVLLVAWGDFQPVAEPCCTYDERAFERLRFVLDRADAAGLKVMLRIGYGWSFHPDAGDVGERQQRLLNRADWREAYHAFVRRIGAEVSGRDEVVLAFMSWEDQWLRRVDEPARGTFAEYLASRPAAGTPRDAAPGGTAPHAAAPADAAPRAATTKDTAPDADAPLPDPATDARTFHGYWDWLVREKLYAPAVGTLPNLSYEARIDREPVWTTNDAGERVVAEWLPHDGMYELPDAPLLTIYWAPFWGALNQGEQLPASRSLELLDALLKEARERSGKPLFVDQFNIVDNTPGHEHNAVLAPAEIPAFLHRAACTLRTGGVAAVGIWTARDYAENPLYNPAFGYGLDGWTLRDGANAAPASALEALPSGDFRVRMAPGRTLAQHVPPRHGRLPRAGDPFADRVCVSADVRAAATLAVRAGGEPVTLAFDADDRGDRDGADGGRQRRCADLVPVPGDDGLDVELRLDAGDLALRDVQVFDHVQYGGLRDAAGAPGPLLEPFRRFADDFRAQPLPPRCLENPGPAAGR